INLDSNSHEVQSQRNRVSKFSKLEKALSLWVDCALDAKLTISGYTLSLQAQKFANLLGILDFKASD
ncbi:15663_t:CDS:1, partial [Racocetra fulgida]